MQGHHLILGQTVDYITGQVIEDTHDERYRQNVARILVEDRGYKKTEIVPRIPVPVKAGDKQARIILDFAVRLAGRYHMIIQYGPGSLITRHRPALALSRILADYQIPVAVVTNGEDADILNGRTGETTGKGLDALPVKSLLMEFSRKMGFSPIPEKQRNMEFRIAYAFEIDDRCPCDDTHADCRISSPADGPNP